MIDMTNPSNSGCQGGLLPGITKYKALIHTKDAEIIFQGGT